MKKGFTLSEILITMGIIGVAAALVFPNLTARINRNTVGITLARTVELTEKGFADMLSVARENATRVGIDDPASISTISVLEVGFLDGNPQNNGNLLDGGGLMQFAQSYIGIDEVPIGSNEYQDYELWNIQNLTNPSMYKFKKYKAYLIFDDDIVGNIGDNPDIVIRNIFFDTNGSDAPNAIGEDIFLFGLTDSGHLVPAGSSAYNHNVWVQNGGDLIGMQCNGDTIPNDDDDNVRLLARLSCAARVVQDGWKVNYSY